MIIAGWYCNKLAPPSPRKNQCVYVYVHAYKTQMSIAASSARLFIWRAGPFASSLDHHTVGWNCMKSTRSYHEEKTSFSRAWELVSEWANEQISATCKGGGQCLANKWVRSSSVSKWTNRQGSGPVLMSDFLVVLTHSVFQVKTLPPTLISFPRALALAFSRVEANRLLYWSPFSHYR